MAKKASVLIVDDNIGLVKTMSFALRRKGYAVTTAEDGPEAVTRVEERPFDIMFMDVKMPVMDGVETYRRIKKIRPEAVVVMMTAYAVEELVQQALQEGAYGIIYKPLDIEKVIALCERARQSEQGALILVVDDDPFNRFIYDPLYDTVYGVNFVVNNNLGFKGYLTKIATGTKNQGQCCQYKQNT